MKTLPSTELLGSSKIEIHYRRPPLDTMEHITCAENADDYFTETYQSQST